MQSNTRELLQYLRCLDWLKRILISGIKIYPDDVKIKLTMGKKESFMSKEKENGIA